MFLDGFIILLWKESTILLRIRLTMIDVTRIFWKLKDPKLISHFEDDLVLVICKISHSTKTSTTSFDSPINNDSMALTDNQARE